MTQQLTAEEITSLKTYNNTKENYLMSLGQIEYQLLALKLQKSTLAENMTAFEKDNETLFASLDTKYGNGTIDLKAGTFTKE
jgi:hypothetical protein